MATVHKSENGEGGRESVAHGKCREANGELGGEPEQSGWRRRSRRREVGDELGEDVRGLSAGRGLVRGRRTEWRSFWASRRGVGWPVAMATASGVDELRSGVLGRWSRGRGRGQRVRERSEELRGVVVASPGGAGEAGGGAGACSAAVRCPPLCLLAKVGGDWHGPGGPAQSR